MAQVHPTFVPGTLRVDYWLTYRWAFHQDEFFLFDIAAYEQMRTFQAYVVGARFEASLPTPLYLGEGKGPILCVKHSLTFPLGVEKIHPGETRSSVHELIRLRNLVRAAASPLSESTRETQHQRAKGAFQCESSWIVGEDFEQKLTPTNFLDDYNRWEKRLAQAATDHLAQLVPPS